jgi:hypothetical protein
VNLATSIWSVGGLGHSPSRSEADVDRIADGGELMSDGMATVAPD